jgi:hypothetical protein
MRKYNLSFIDDRDLFKHVKETIEKYRFSINLKEFNKNLVDPIKLTFDSKVYGKTIEEIIEMESVRQMDKWTNQIVIISAIFNRIFLNISITKRKKRAVGMFPKKVLILLMIQIKSMLR